jgi:hypothetical protein
MNEYLLQAERYLKSFEIVLPLSGYSPSFNLGNISIRIKFRVDNSRNQKLKHCLICVTAATFAGILIVLPGFTAAMADDLPSMYERFYGTVVNNDEVVCSGYIVSAIVGATKIAETATDAQGRYGYGTEFLVAASPGAIIQFSLNDHPTLQRVVFQGGAATRLDLRAYGAAPQMPQTSCSGGACSGASCGINPKTLPEATVGRYYSAALQASGGVMPYSWSISTDSLPPGLTIDRALGVISGIPTTAQTYLFTVRVSDSASNYLTESEYIRVNDAAGPSQTSPSVTVSVQPQKTAGAVQGATYNFLNNSDSLPVSNGVLGAAKELASSDGRVRLGLPSGDAINLQGQTVIGAGNESNPPAATDGSVAIKAYSFTPPGATFSPPATMTLRYDTPLPSQIDEAALYISYWNGSSWVKLPSFVNTLAKEVSADIPHFTVFAIRGMPQTAGGAQASGKTTAESPAAFAFSDLVISPETVRAGLPVTATIRVSNHGGAEGTRTVTLKLDDQDEQRKDVTLIPGASQLVSFDITKNDPGVYTVKIENLSDTFYLTGQAETVPARQPDVQPIIVAVVVSAGGLLAVILVLRLVFRRRSHYSGN